MHIPIYCQYSLEIMLGKWFMGKFRPYPELSVHKVHEANSMKLCSYKVDVQIPDQLTEEEQVRLLEAVDALNLPLRLRRCVRATLDHFVAPRTFGVTVED